MKLHIKNIYLFKIAFGDGSFTTDLSFDIAIIKVSDSSGVYICKSVVNYLRHGHYICESEVIYLTYEHRIEIPVEFTHVNQQ